MNRRYNKLAIIFAAYRATQSLTAQSLTHGQIELPTSTAHAQQTRYPAKLNINIQPRPPHLRDTMRARRQKHFITEWQKAPAKTYGPQAM